MPLIVYTIGHSTRTLEAFTELLRAHGVEAVADVRTVPRSRHNPQFNLETLPDGLRNAGIGYQHYPGLGGLRHARRDSLNTGWVNASFRGYADYMQQPEFEESLLRFIAEAQQRPTTLMCAEAVPWRCHRSLIADALVARGCQVEHIMSTKRAQIHTLTPFARLDGTRVTYPAPLAPEEE